MVISFKTLGCRLNQAEEEDLKRQFLKSGFMISAPKTSDICIINSCSVTKAADVKCYRLIKKLKLANPGLKIIVIGCGANLACNYPEVDHWITNKNKHQTFDIIASKYQNLRNFALGSQKAESTQNVLSETSNNKSVPRIGGNGYKEEKCDNLENSLLPSRTRALLKIQDGCNNFCSYCVVPYVRGREVSKLPKIITTEAKKLYNLGYRELVLTGVNIGKWGRDIKSSAANERNLSLYDLLVMLLKETKFPRIRLSSINPEDITDEIIELWSREPRLCRHLHLSLQSGSNSVLKRMGRQYSVQNYYSLTKKIVQKIPEIAITTDIIVGFPGETNREFEETYDFVKKVKFTKIHVFRYSKREGTPAAKMTSQVPENLKIKRSQALQKVADDLGKEIRQSFIGKKMMVLFESKKGEYWPGLTSNYFKVKVKSRGNIQNKILGVKIDKIDKKGELIGKIIKT